MKRFWAFAVVLITVTTIEANWGMQVKAVVSSPYQPIVQENIIAAGYNHTIVIKADGSLWAWGNNECGELGDGTNTACSTPVKIMDGVGAVSCAYLYTIAIKTDGTLWA